jgi:hypothetical protein
MNPDDRTYTMVTSNGREVGRFVGKTPARAAQKAGSEKLRDSKQNSVVVHIRETTRGCKKQEPRAYRVQRVRKTHPVETDYATFKYDIVAKSLRPSSKKSSSKKSSSKKSAAAEGAS